MNDSYDDYLSSLMSQVPSLRALFRPVQPALNAPLERQSVPMEHPMSRPGRGHGAAIDLPGYYAHPTEAGGPTSSNNALSNNDEKVASVLRQLAAIQNPAAPSGMPRPGASGIALGIGALLNALDKHHQQGAQFAQGFLQGNADQQNWLFQSALDAANQKRTALQTEAQILGAKGQRIEQAQEFARQQEQDKLVRDAQAKLTFDQEQSIQQTKARDAREEAFQRFVTVGQDPSLPASKRYASFASAMSGLSADDWRRPEVGRAMSDIKPMADLETVIGKRLGFDEQQSKAAAVNLRVYSPVNLEKTLQVMSGAVARSKKGGKVASDALLPAEIQRLIAISQDQLKQLEIKSRNATAGLVAFEPKDAEDAQILIRRISDLQRLIPPVPVKRPSSRPVNRTSSGRAFWRG